MHKLTKKAVGLMLSAAMLVGLVPTSALAANTSLSAADLGGAVLYVDPENKKDIELTPLQDNQNYLPNFSAGRDNIIYPYIVPISNAQYEGEEPIQVRAKAQVTMTGMVSSVLQTYDTLDIKNTKFLILMAISNNLSVKTEDLVFNSTFLMPDESAMPGMEVTRIENPYGDETYQSNRTMDMFWEISGNINNLKVIDSLPISNLDSENGNQKIQKWIREESYLKDLGQYSNQAVGTGTGWSQCDVTSLTGAACFSDVAVYAIPVKMNWEELLKEETAGNISFENGYKYTPGDENGPKGGMIYAGFTSEDWMHPMQLNGLPYDSQNEGIIMQANADDATISRFMTEIWGYENKFDYFIPTSDEKPNGDGTTGWNTSVDSMPFAGTIVAGILAYDSETATVPRFAHDIFAGGGGRAMPTINAGTIMVQFSLATPGAITVTKTIEGLPGDVEMPDSLAITITDQNGNPARDLSGNVVTASIGKADWTYDAATGNWTATKTIEGLRPSDDTYGWDYQYNVAVEEETGFEGYEVNSAVEITGGENIELDNGYYDLTREDNGDVIYKLRDDAAVPQVVVHSSYKQGTTPPEKVTLTYDPNGGDGPNQTETKELVDEKAEFTVIENPFTRDEADGVTYTFDGWNTQANGGGTDYAPGDQITLTEDETLYAQWKAEGEEPVEPPATMISKTLSGNLDKDNQTDVTLSIPSKGSEQTVDVVLAMDCTSLLAEHGADVIQNIGTLGDELLEKNINLSVGVVGFGRESRVVHELTALNKGNSDSWAADIAADIWENQAWFLNNVGTNIQGGIRMAQEVLDRSTTGADENHKYIVLITDGGAYWYCDDQDIDGDGNTSEAVNKFFYNGETFWGALGNMDGNGDVGDKNRTTHLSQSEDFADFMNTFGGAVENSIAPSYTYEQLANPTEGMVALTAGEVQSDDFILNIERGTYLAARELEKALDNGYQLITIGYPYENAENAPALRNVSDSFLAWTGTIGDYYDGAELDSAFSDLADQIAYFVDAGSYVIDEMGSGTDKGWAYDFDFVNDAQT